MRTTSSTSLITRVTPNLLSSLNMLVIGEQEATGTNEAYIIVEEHLEKSPDPVAVSEHIPDLVKLPFHSIIVCVALHISDFVVITSNKISMVQSICKFNFL